MNMRVMVGKKEEEREGIWWHYIADQSRVGDKQCNVTVVTPFVCM